MPPLSTNIRRSHSETVLFRNFIAMLVLHFVLTLPVRTTRSLRKLNLKFKTETLPRPQPQRPSC